MKNSMLIIGLLIFFASCERTVNIELPEHTPQLVSFSEFRGVDYEPLIVEHTVGALSETEPQRISNATVEVFKNEQLYASFLYDNQYEIYQPASPISFDDTDATYKLQISAPNYETITAIQTLPEIVELSNIDYKALTKTTEWGEQQDELILTFQDRPDEENFYQINIVYEPKDSFGYRNEYPYITSEDPAVFTTWSQTLVSDPTFDGKNYKIVLNIEHVERSEHYIYIRFSHINKDKYFYLKSLQQYQESGDNPFAEPVILYTNFDKGQGLFSIENTYEVLY